MERTKVWKSRPIFITSTFLDMQAERDHLRQFVFPSLEEWLRSKRRHLEWIDLRVGVASAGTSDENAREIQVLKVCLDEVERSRPFLIALIGDRYGWVPPKERIAAAAKAAKFSHEVEDRSITDLEIDFGVFHNTDQQRRCLFFLRDPLPYKKMRHETAALYSDARAKDEKAAARYKRLQDLKERIRRDFPDRCFPYMAQWNKRSKCVTGLEAFGLEVEARIRQELEKELAAEPSAFAELSEDDVERDILTDFAEDRARDFVGREDVIAVIERLFASPAHEGAPWGLCITGEAGSGKSALFGALYQGLKGIEKSVFCNRLRKFDTLTLSHAAAASPRAASPDAMLRRWIGELASFLGVKSGLAEDARPDEVDAAFTSLLGQAAQNKRVIVLIDALDQFEQTDRGRFVNWLPQPWPDNARLVATAIPGDVSDALSKRSGLIVTPLPPLNAREAREMAVAISKRYHRTLENEVLDALTGGTGARWRNPLWLLLATEALNLLDADDFARARRMYTGRDDEKLRSLMSDMAADFPPDVPGMYKASFSHASDLFGKKATQAFLGLIAASRTGWREGDFRALLPKLSGEDWDELRFAQLRRTFRGQMRQRGASGQWDFAHTQMRLAVKAWLRETSSFAETSLHTVLGDHLLGLPADDALHVSETMVHLIEGKEAARRAAHYYGNPPLTDAELDGATRVLADIVLASPDPVAGTRRVTQLLEASKVPDAILGNAAERMLFDLDDAIAHQVALEPRSALLNAVKDVLFEVMSADHSDARWRRDIPIANDKIGDMLVAQGDLAWALRSYRFSLDIRLKFRDGSADWERNLAISWEKIGSVLAAQGNLSEALKAFRDAFTIADLLAWSAPEDARLQRDLAVSHDHIGSVLRAQGNLSEARKEFQDGLAVVERLARADPDNVGLQSTISTFNARVGDILVSERDLDGALRAFHENLTIAERLARSDPENTDWRLSVLTAWMQIGDVLISQGKLAEAMTALQYCLEIADRLVRSDPKNAEWQNALGFSWVKIGDVLLAQSNVAEAHKAFRSGFDIRQRLAWTDFSNARWQRDLSISYDRMGDVLVAQGNLPEALEPFNKSLAIRRDLTQRDPGNIQWQGDLASSYGRIASVLRAQGRVFELLKLLRESVAVLDRLVQSDSDNVGWLQSLSITYQQIGHALANQDDLPNALGAMCDAYAVAERLAQSDPGNVEWQHGLAVALANIGEMWRELGQRGEALNQLTQSMEIMEKIATANPANEQFQKDAARFRETIAALTA